MENSITRDPWTGMYFCECGYSGTLVIEEDE